MKKINSRKDIKKNTASFINNAFVPLLVLGCVCLALVGITFSYKVDLETTDHYDINLEIVDGEIKEYHNRVDGGISFRDTLHSEGEFAGITCTQGVVEYDRITDSFYVPFVNSNVECTIIFKDITAKYLSLDGLNPIYDNDGTSYYYPGEAKNNYFMFNGMMFRIVRINGDGSYRVVLDESDLSFNYGVSNYFSDSNLQMVLNKWFNENLKGSKYVVEGEFDISSYTDVDVDTLVNLDGSYNSYVGTLNAREAALVLLNSKENYLGDMLLLNGTSNNKVFALKDNKVTVIDITLDMPIKPVINITNVDLDGFGTIDNPYVIKED